MRFNLLSQQSIGQYVKIKSFKNSDAEKIKNFNLLKRLIEKDNTFIIFEMDKNFQRQNNICIMKPNLYFKFWVSHRDLDLINEEDKIKSRR